MFEINTMLINKDAKPIDENILFSTENNLTNNVPKMKNQFNKVNKVNKLEIYEEEVSKNKKLKGLNLDLNKKFKIMQELVMNK